VGFWRLARGVSDMQDNDFFGFGLVIYPIRITAGQDNANVWFVGTLTNFGKVRQALRKPLDKRNQLAGCFRISFDR
jgi:hypothetical protein